MDASSLVRLSPMHYRHIELGATMIDEEGWQRPLVYSTGEKEFDELRSNVGLCDISPLGKLLLQGEDVDMFLRSFFADADVTNIGEAVTHNLFDREGSFLDQLLICRLAQDQLFIVTSCKSTLSVIEMIEGFLGGCIHLVDQTSSLAAMKLAGPRGSNTLAKLTDLNLTAKCFQDMTCSQSIMANVPVMVVRTDSNDQLCYQLFVSRDLGEFLWDAIMDAGHEWVIVPFGEEALGHLREGGL